MIVLREYESSPPVSLQFFDNASLRTLLRRQLRVTNLSSTTASICSNGYSGRISIGDEQFLFLPRYGKEVLDSLIPLAYGVHLDSIDDRLNIHDTGFLLDEAVAWLFINCYRETIAKNIRWQYQPELEKNLLSSGSLEVPRSMVALSYGVGAYTWRRSKLTRETPFNTLVRRVFELLLNSLKVSNYTKSALKQCSDEVCAGDLEQPLELKRISRELDRTTAHYRPFLDFAERLSLSNTIVSGSQKSPSFLIRTWEIFERAVRTATKECVKDMGLSVNNSGGLGLNATESGSNKLEPDIIVYQPDRGILLVADVKYQHLDRLELDRSNLFQINAYLNGYGLDRGALLYPTNGAFEVQEFQLRWKKTISVYRIPVTSQHAFITGVDQFLVNELSKIPTSLTVKTDKS